MIQVYFVFKFCSIDYEADAMQSNGHRVTLQSNVYIFFL